jgi:hydroxymethylbilane synthase
MSSIPFRLGTRGSQLALYQAHLVARLLADAGGPACEIVVIRTSGDRLQEAPLSDVGGKRLFVKEIEDALLRDEVDLAVHSSKDMPAALPEGLTIAGVLPREDPHDAVILPRPGDGTVQAPVDTIQELVARVGSQPTIGTSSVRRIAELTRVFPKARFLAIRGNLETRLRKLDEGGYDMLVLAAAGLKRLGQGDRISLAIDTAVSVPAPGQGIIAIEIRSDDGRARDAVERIRDAGAWTALAAERAVVERLGGGCQTPIGALAVAVNDREIELSATVVALDGSRAVRVTAIGSNDDPSALGIRVADELVSKGADEILEDVRGRQGE